MMPKMNGEELFQKLFAHNPSVKGILVTGAIDLKAKTEFLTMGIRDIITKPFLFDECWLSSERCWTVNEYPLCVHRQYFAEARWALLF